MSSTNTVASGSGNLRHTIAVDQRSGGAANNGMTSIGDSHDLFNATDRTVVVLPDSGNGGFSCVTAPAQTRGDCTGARLEADGMTVVLDQVVVADLAGNRRTVTGRFEARAR